VTVYRRVHRFTRLLADPARFTRHAPGDRWFVDETYVKVSGVWRYVYRAIDQNLRLGHYELGAGQQFATLLPSGRATLLLIEPATRYSVHWRNTLRRMDR
jgi:transposase InsO family protein